MSAPLVAATSSPNLARGRLAHVHSRRGRVGALGGGEVHAQTASVDGAPVALLPRPSSVVEPFEGDEAEAATPTRHPVVDEDDVLDAAVAREEVLHLAIGGHGIEIEHAQAFVFRRGDVHGVAGTASHGRSGHGPRSGKGARPPEL